MTTAVAGAACSVCSERLDGGPECPRCGYPCAPGAVAASETPATPATPVESAPPNMPQGVSFKFRRSPPTDPPAPRKPQHSAAADLEEAFRENPAPAAPPAKPTNPSLPREASPGLPQAGVSQGLEYQEQAPAAALPQAGRNEQTFYEATQAAPAPKTAPKKSVKRKAPAPPLLPAGFFYILKSALSIAFLLGILVSGVLIFLWQRSAQGPKAAVPRIAHRYLTALATTDYGSAYYLLSAQSQARCTMDEFRKMRGPGEWKWGDLKVVALESDAAEVSYEWSAPGRQTQTVYMFVVREGDRWVVPYNLNLLKDVEEAVRAGDPDLALLDSQEAVRVNPRDPMARAYLCEAANFRKLYEQAKPACEQALSLAQKYPSNLSQQSVEHVKAVLASMDQGK